MEAIGDQALTMNLVFGTLVFAAAAKIYVLPRLRPSDPACRRLQPPASKGNSKAKSLELTEVLLDAHDHRIRPHQVFDASLAKADLAHPSLAIRACIIESARRLDKHVQAHEQSE